MWKINLIYGLSYIWHSQGKYYFIHLKSTFVFNILFNHHRNWFTFFWRFNLYIYIFRDRRKDGKGKETSMYGCLSHAPYWGPGLQLRHVPWLRINQQPLGSQDPLNPLSHNSQVLSCLIFKWFPNHSKKICSICQHFAFYILQKHAVLSLKHVM